MKHTRWLFMSWVLKIPWHNALLCFDFLSVDTVIAQIVSTLVWKIGTSTLAGLKKCYPESNFVKWSTLFL